MNSRYEANDINTLNIFLGDTIRHLFYCKLKSPSDKIWLNLKRTYNQFSDGLSKSECIASQCAFIMTS